MTDKLTMAKLSKMTTPELKELRKKYNEEEHEFILFAIDYVLYGRLDK